MREREGEEIGEPAQAGILGERREQRLRFSQLIGQRREIVEGQVKQGVTCKERLAGRIVDGAELVARAQRISQGARSPLHPLRTAALDHGDHRVAESGKRLGEIPQVAAKRRVGRDHIGRAGVDPQVLEGDCQRDRRQEQREQNEREWPGCDAIGQPDREAERSPHVRPASAARACGRVRNVVTCAFTKERGGKRAR